MPLRVQVRESFTEIRDQRIEIYVFDWDVQCAVAILAAASLCLAGAGPVGGAVAGAFESGPVNKGFDEVDGVAVLGRPIGCEPADNMCQEVTGKVRDADPGEDEEPGIIGGPVEAVGAGGIAPADEAVAGSRFPCGGAEEQARQVAPMAIAGQIGEVFTNGSSVAEVMVLREVGGECPISGMPGRKQFDRDRSNILQTRYDGLGSVVKAGETGSGLPALDGFTPGWWESDQATTMQFERQSPGSHVFEPSGAGAPVPGLGKFFGDTVTMPIRVSRDQLLNLKEVLLGKSTTLNVERF